MSDEKFDIVFAGQLAKGVELSVAKKNMCSLFKASPEKIDRMFNSASVTLKKNLDIDAAAKYRVALKKAGVIVEVREVVIKKEIKPVKSMGKAVFKVEEASVSVVEGRVVEESDAIDPPAQEDAPQVGSKSNVDNVEIIDLQHVPLPEVAEVAETELVGGNTKTAKSSKEPAAKVFANQVIELLPVGSDVLAQEERQNIESLSVDTSALSLKEMAGPLVEVTEITYPDAVIVGDTDFEMSDVGADVIPEEYRRTVPEPVLDLSHLALMDVGELLERDERDNAVDRLPLIDVSHLSLADV